MEENAKQIAEAMRHLIPFVALGVFFTGLAQIFKQTPGQKGQ